MRRLRALRGPLATCVDDPFLVGPRRAVHVEDDGGVLIEDGAVVAVGPWARVRRAAPRGADLAVDDHRDALIVPGFVDAHVHYVQSAIVGARADGLLDWLNRHAYPAERAFANRAHARKVAAAFCDTLLRNGTTTALVFCSVHEGSVDALFQAAFRRGMRLFAGKVLMDRNAPADLRDDAESGYLASKALIGRWHGRGRLGYAITPRFAASCSDAQLAAAGALWAEFPEACVHSHVSESREEVAWVRRLFPRDRDYVGVYERHGLVGPRALFAHGVHLGASELARLHRRGAAVVHCPTSNAFLGSGSFRVHVAKDHRRPVQVAMGTDVGAGTSFSMLQTAGEAYKVARLRGARLTVEEALFLATLGGARALGIEAHAGVLAPGRDADVVVLDPRATPEMALVAERAESVLDLLFLLMTMGDSRAVRATYVAGDRARL